MYGWRSAESDGVKASTTSWMNQMPLSNSESEWLLSPSSSGSRTSHEKTKSGSALYALSYVYYDNVVRPVLHLTPSVKLLKGTGTDIDPYIFVK